MVAAYNPGISSTSENKRRKRKRENENDNRLIAKSPQKVKARDSVPRVDSQDGFAGRSETWCLMSCNVGPRRD